MKITHIFFGGIGTLIETSEIQYAAFNQAFKKNGIDFVWKKDDYINSLNISGGTKRLQTISLPNKKSLSEKLCQKIHKDKTAIFNLACQNKALALRSGAHDLIESARKLDIDLVWATTTHQSNIDNMFSSSIDSFSKDLFSFISNKRFVTKQKPDPEVYLKIIKHLNINPKQAIAIEDSLSGAASAMAASIRTYAFPGEMTSSTNIPNEIKVLKSLHDIMHVISEANC